MVGMADSCPSVPHQLSPLMTAQNLRAIYTGVFVALAYIVYKTFIEA